ncbi:Transcriptional regulator, GntR family / Transcriptional regulator, TetR family protein [Minicystis rosea]|nr:Transcriptional regulator, GntR family / Transcriptional regulator, TetR family protein [Minicystis rosea]
MVRRQAHEEPISNRIVADLARRISSGELKPGDRVPSTRQIMRRWRVAMATATKALTALQREGLVRSIRGSGCVVAGKRTIRDARRPKKAEPGQLTRESVVRVAIAIADGEGLGSVSIRRVAMELGAAPMAIYRHVPSKEDLLQSMAEMVMGEAGLPTHACAGWKERLDAIARLQWSIYKQHAWLAQVFSSTFSRPTVAPNAMAHTEWMLAAIGGFRLGGTERLHLATTLTGYVQGTALKLVSEVDAQSETGVSREEWLRAASAAVDAYIQSGKCPELGRALAEGADLDLDSLFDFGLCRLLDGFADFIERRSDSELRRGHRHERERESARK